MMRKRIVCILLLLAAVLCLSGCYPENAEYEQSDADMIVRKGTKLLEAWLDENMPGTELESIEAHRIRSVDYDSYLTDYAMGEIQEDGTPTLIFVNTETGEIYRLHRKQELWQLTGEYLCEMLGIVYEEETNFLCYVMAPICLHDPAPGVEFIQESLDLGIPPEAEADLEAYVRNPTARLPIYIEIAEFVMPDGTLLLDQDPAVLQTLEEQCGVYFPVLHGEGTWPVAK